jgi:hypothetical protein
MTPAGGSEQFLGTYATAVDNESDMEDGGDGVLVFGALVGPLQSTTSFRVQYAGKSGNSSADAVTVVYVRPRIVLGSSASSIKTGRSVTLKATVWPSATAGSQVVFEYNYSGNHWRAIGTQTLTATASSATASVTWKAVKGKHNLRVRYLGGPSNVAVTSGTIAVTGK